MEKKSPFLSFLELLVFLLFLLPASDRLCAATIELGIGSETISIAVEKNNLPDSVLNDTTPPPAVPAALPQNTVAPAVDSDSELKKDFPHIYTSPKDLRQLSPRPNATLQKVLQEQSSAGGQSLTGKGEKELVAVADGEVSLEVYLFTYRNAEIIVRLYDEEGDEIRFSGQSLLEWSRVNDFSYAPVKYKGVTDSSSMYEETSGNYSPVRGISYKLDIKKGQKLVLSISGGAEDSSYVRTSGSVF